MLNLTDLIPFGMMNFSLVMAILAMIIILLHIIVNFFTRYHTGYEIIYSWMSLLGVGATCIYAFIMHVFFPVTAAAAIGWHTSPFQFETGIADLGFGLVAILAFRASYSFRLASVIGVTCWLWGDAVGHVYQMVLHNDYAIGNAGSWFWMDILLPAILILCIIPMKPTEEERDL